jgi:hypothetical protein
MPPTTREHAAWFLTHGYFLPGTSSALLDRLDGWAARAEIAGPATLAALRTEAGLAVTEETA